jgi:hypothetical protein
VLCELDGILNLSGIVSVWPQKKSTPLTSYAPRGGGGRRRRRRVATSPFQHHLTISPFCNRAVADANAASSQFPSKFPFLNAQNKLNRWILSAEPKAKRAKKEKKEKKKKKKKRRRRQPRDTNTNAFPKEQKN